VEGIHIEDLLRDVFGLLDLLGKLRTALDHQGMGIGYV
tara:strand:- start:1223 stop:1336 length:114 start_codon:yes stop_codon:yes gene_type:complete